MYLLGEMRRIEKVRERIKNRMIRAIEVDTLFFVFVIGIYSSAIQI
jgi:hypothetical protein